MGKCEVDCGRMVSNVRDQVDSGIVVHIIMRSEILVFTADIPHEKYNVLGLIKMKTTFV